LKQDRSKDVIYNPEESLSFEGGSGPYLQYTHARISSLLEKGESESLYPLFVKSSAMDELSELERVLIRFENVVERAQLDYAPHYISTYLLEMTQKFNSWYGNHKVIDVEQAALSSHRLAVSLLVKNILKEGLWMLGIAAPEKM
jgi:arginyl-tRNA synthetase